MTCPVKKSLVRSKSSKSNQSKATDCILRSFRLLATMPESKKMAKNREQAANRAAGLGDEQGRLPSRVSKLWKTPALESL